MCARPFVSGANYGTPEERVRVRRLPSAPLPWTSVSSGPGDKQFRPADKFRPAPRSYYRFNPGVVRAANKLEPRRRACAEVANFTRGRGVYRVEKESCRGLVDALVCATSVQDF